MWNSFLGLLQQILTWWLKTREIFLSQFWRQGVWNQGMSLRSTSSFLSGLFCTKINVWEIYPWFCMELWFVGEWLYSILLFKEGTIYFFHFTSKKAMAPHSSTLAWKIPWRKEPGRLQSMGLLGVGHDWETSLSLFTFMHWRRKWLSTPVFLPGESQGQGSLVGYRLWVPTELDTTEAT